MERFMWLWLILMTGILWAAILVKQFGPLSHQVGL